MTVIGALSSFRDRGDESSQTRFASLVRPAIQRRTRNPLRIRVRTQHRRPMPCRCDGCRRDSDGLPALPCTDELPGRAAGQQGLLGDSIWLLVE